MICFPPQLPQRVKIKNKIIHQSNGSEMDSIIENQVTNTICGNSNLEDANDPEDAEKSGASDERTNSSNNNSTKDEQQDSSNQESPLNDKDDTKENADSLAPTAFIISFDGASNINKKLDIKDSIRKFAPPKPYTIEKPRVSKDQSCHDESLTSIESAPGCLLKRAPITSPGKECYSSRSSSRKSTHSSRHSNISESAAFLIDKMLNFRQNNGSKADSGKIATRKTDIDPRSSRIPTDNSSQSKRMTQSLSHDLQNEAEDFGEDHSDNGTYIVGTDHESDAARKKIDEMFGLVKSAGQLKTRESQQVISASRLYPDRPSRMTTKEILSFNRDNNDSKRNLSASPSSSSSPFGNNVNRSRSIINNTSSSRRSRNSSCDRVTKTQGAGRQHRRSASQSSRQSSGKELSEDTTSSRSSLNQNNEQNENYAISNHPNMKFNRAFALRRARLGLCQPSPSRVPSSTFNQGNNLENQNNDSAEPLNCQLYSSIGSQKRNQVNTNTYKASSGSASFCRQDGGRFSLRTKNPQVPTSKLHRSPHQQLSKLPTTTNVNILPVESSSIQSPTRILSPRFNSQRSSLNTSTALPQHRQQNHHLSGDEVEKSSPSRQYNRIFMQSSSSRYQKKSPTDLDLDSIHQDHGLVQQNHQRHSNFNFIPTSDHEANMGSLGEIGGARNISSAGGDRATTAGARRGNLMQLGALDSLVLSAISSLSLKIRHSVCDILVEQAKKLPAENETRLIVEEILPQLTVNTSNPKSPTSIEEIEQSLYFDLAKTLKNLKKVEQMVDVVKMISNQLPSSSSPVLSSSSTSQDNTSVNSNSKFTAVQSNTGSMEKTGDSPTDLSPI